MEVKTVRNGVLKNVKKIENIRYNGASYLDVTKEDNSKISMPIDNIIEIIGGFNNED